MAGILSNYNKSSKLGQDTKHLENMTPEGVEGYVTFKGPVKDIVQQIEGGIQSGLSYVGCHTLEELKHTKIEFLLMTSNGYKESGSHNIKEI
jgi:IMP dehydrogenase